jgi:hypothetical protein
MQFLFPDDVVEDIKGGDVGGDRGRGKLKSLSDWTAEDFAVNRRIIDAKIAAAYANGTHSDRIERYCYRCGLMKPGSSYAHNVQFPRITYCRECAAAMGDEIAQRAIAAEKIGEDAAAPTEAATPLPDGVTRVEDIGLPT